jgi:hypothetical protein
MRGSEPEIKRAGLLEANFRVNKRTGASKLKEWGSNALDLNV